MPRKTKDGQPFDQTKYINQWQKENMKAIKASYSSSFVDSFKEACQILGISQSSVFRKAMEETIKNAKG